MTNQAMADKIRELELREAYLRGAEDALSDFDLVRQVAGVGRDPSAWLGTARRQVAWQIRELKAMWEDGTVRRFEVECETVMVPHATERASKQGASA